MLKRVSLSSILSHKSFVCAIFIDAKKIGFVTPSPRSRTDSGGTRQDLCDEIFTKMWAESLLVGYGPEP